MINVTDKSQCCGCTACANICSHNAIHMKEDSLGFAYPIIDNSKCVQCELCLSICQFHESYNRYSNFEEPQVYALRLKNANQLSRSQSGGAFYAIACEILKQNGIVYGAAFTKEWHVAHTKATNLGELEQLRMSKYVQSDINGTMKEIKGKLKQGFPVLFSGTACQVAGLKSYIPSKLHKNLICIDIICHGVPSPKIWKDYIQYLENKHQSPIIKACFRDKRFGWRGATETFQYKNGDEEIRKTNNRLYFSGLSLRACCANCHFTNLKRIGDLSIGDYWGYKKTPFYEDNKGLSLLLINSYKGEKLFQTISSLFDIEKSDTVACLQPQLQYPTSLNPLYKKFISDYERYGFLYIAKKYGDMGWRFKIKTVQNILKKILKSYIKQ